jgi:hypothetical protein
MPEMSLFRYSAPTEVAVAVHPETFGQRLGFLCKWLEQSMAEVAFTRWSSLRLSIVPQVIVRKLQNTRQQGEQAAVDRVGHVLRGCQR